MTSYEQILDGISREMAETSDSPSAHELRKRLAVSALIVHCEKVAAAGCLIERDEAHLRLMIAEVRMAFGPSIPERDLPSNVIHLRD